MGKFVYWLIVCLSFLIHLYCITEFFVLTLECILLSLNTAVKDKP